MPVAVTARKSPHTIQSDCFLITGTTITGTTAASWCRSKRFLKSLLYRKNSLHTSSHHAAEHQQQVKWHLNFTSKPQSDELAQQATKLRLAVLRWRFAGLRAAIHLALK